MFENENLEKITEILHKKGTILIPTDTVWGVCCDATDDDAVAKVQKIKQKTAKTGFVVLVSDLAMLKSYLEEMPPRIETLLVYHTRPLTIVYTHTKGLSDLVASADGSVAIRIVQDSFCADLIAHFGKPIVATLACTEGGKPPTHFGEISSDILENMDFVARFGRDNREAVMPSVIAKMNNDEELDFLRE